jgi:hypothetical protein
MPTLLTEIKRFSTYFRALSQLMAGRSARQPREGVGVARPRADLLKRAHLWEAQGLAHRTGRDYAPFLTVRDFPSTGRVHRVVSATVGRLHHLMSDHEYRAFLVLDHNPGVTDIREQYPLLPLSETMALAHALGIRHPAYRGRISPMTTDFLVTYGEGGEEVAYQVKPSAELSRRRVAEKLDLERAYWGRRGIAFRLITEREVPVRAAEALDWIRAYRDPADLDSGPGGAAAVLAALDVALAPGHCASIDAACARVERDLRLPPGAALGHVRYGLALRRWPVDLSRGIDTRAALPWR